MVPVNVPRATESKIGLVINDGGIPNRNWEFVQRVILSKISLSFDRQSEKLQLFHWISIPAYFDKLGFAQLTIPTELGMR